MKNLVIWGASGHARVITEIIRLSGEYTVTGYLDDLTSSRFGEMFCGAPILGGREQLRNLAAVKNNHILLAIGNNQARMKLANILRQYGLQLATAIHPKAIVSQSVEIGSGTVIVAGAVVNANVVLGENVIVNTASTIDHDCHIEAGVHLSPGVHLGGSVIVGKGAWIGIGAVVSDHIKIGEWSVVGAGAVIVNDVPANTTVVGIPGKVIKTHPEGWHLL